MIDDRGILADERGILSCTTGIFTSPNDSQEVLLTVNCVCDFVFVMMHLCNDHFVMICRDR